MAQGKWIFKIITKRNTHFKDVEEANPEIKEYLEFYKELSLFEKQAKDFD